MLKQAMIGKRSLISIVSKNNKKLSTINIQIHNINKSLSFQQTKQQQQYYFSTSFLTTTNTNNNNQKREIKLGNFIKKQQDSDLEVDLVEKFKKDDTGDLSGNIYGNNENNKNEEENVNKPTSSSSYRLNKEGEQQQVSEQANNNISFEELITEGDDFMEKKIYYKATERYTKAIKQKPNDYKGYLQRSKAYLLHGEISLAMKDMEKASSIISTKLLSEQRKEEELSISEEELQEDMIRLIELHHNKGVLLMEEGKVENAIQEYKTAIDLIEKERKNSLNVVLSNNKLLIECLNNLGFIYLENKKDYEKALEYFNKAIEIVTTEQQTVDNSSNNVDNKLYYNRGRTKIELERYNEAIEDLMKFHTTNEKHHSCNLLLAKCYFENENYIECIKHCDLAYQTLRENIDTDSTQLSKDDKLYYKERISYLLLLKGKSHLMLNDFERADKFYSLAVESNRKDIFTWIERGRERLLAQRYDEAIFDFTTALNRLEAISTQAPQQGSSNNNNFGGKNNNQQQLDTIVGVLLSRAKCFEKKRDLYSAIGDYEQVIHYLTAANNLASIDDDSSSSIDSSSSSKETIISIVIPTLCRIALLYVENNTKETPKALTTLKKAIQLGQEINDIFTMEALHHRYHIYLSIYQYLIQNKDSSSPNAKLYYERAIDDITKIINTFSKVNLQELNEDDIQLLKNAYYNRGLLYFKEEEYNKAIVDLENLIEKLVENPILRDGYYTESYTEINKILLKSHLKLGNYLRAIRYLFK
ncbi:hypothetical protein ABK040_003292 [Willaertia magna]